MPPLWEMPHEAENEGEKYTLASPSCPPAFHLPLVPPLGQIQIEANQEVQPAGVNPPSSHGSRESREWLWRQTKQMLSTLILIFALFIKIITLVFSIDFFFPYVLYHICLTPLILLSKYLDLSYNPSVSFCFLECLILPFQSGWFALGLPQCCCLRPSEASGQLHLEEWSLIVAPRLNSLG